MPSPPRSWPVRWCLSGRVPSWPAMRWPSISGSSYGPRRLGALRRSTAVPRTSSSPPGTLYWSWLIPVVAVAVFAVNPEAEDLLRSPACFWPFRRSADLGLIPFRLQVVSTVTEPVPLSRNAGRALALAFSLRGNVLIRGMLTALFVIAWTVVSLIQLPCWASGEAFFQATLEETRRAGSPAITTPARSTPQAGTRGAGRVPGGDPPPSLQCRGP